MPGGQGLLTLKKMASIINILSGDDNGTIKDNSYRYSRTYRSIDYVTESDNDFRAVLLGYGLPNLGEDSDGGVFLRSSISAFTLAGEGED